MKKGRLIAAGFVLALVASLWWYRSPVEALTAPELKAARQKWTENAPLNYRFAVRISGVQTGRNAITVRDGKVVAMTSEGDPVRESAWHYWTMEGMFGFMEEEMAICESRKDKDIFLHARFDPKLGYPTYFLRQVFGVEQTIEWHIEDFEIDP